MTLEHFLAQALVILGSAVAVLLLCHRIHLPSVVGLLLTGVLIGPSGLGLVAGVEEVEVFAEIGVVLLLFAIGLEFSLSRLQELRRAFFAGGSGQAALTLAVVVAAGLLLGFRGAESVFYGFVLVLSSTAIVLKLYSDRRETDSAHGKVILGILLFQDFLIVPMIVLTPVLGGSVPTSALGLLTRFGGSLVAVALVFLAARRLMPLALRQLVLTRMREIFVMGALLACLALAWVTDSLGFSLALGAFVAGILVSETDYSHQVVADMAPFRDVFSSLFFISIGMLVDVPFALRHLGTVAALTTGIVVVKATAGTVAARAIGYPSRIATLVGCALAQIGEFSFVLMEVGRQHGLLPDERYQALLAAAVLTMVLTPLLILVAPALGDRLGDRRGGPGSEVPVGTEGLPPHVVIVGFGTNGSLLARVLKESRIPYLVIEFNGDTVRRAREAGEPVLFGDSTRREILEHAGIARACVVVFAISDLPAVRRSIRLARELAPHAEIIVRTQTVGEIEELRALGADQVVAQEFETAIEIFTRVLERYHVPRHIIRAQTRVLRGESYRMLRAPVQGRDIPEAVLDALTAGTTEVFQVEAASAACGRTLRQLDLRRRSGASVIALVRDGSSLPSPSPEVTLRRGDALVLVGSHQEIDQALVLLGEDAPAAAPAGGTPSL
jgi:CPA2 family monovalent cation:H+ antiporter-2